MIIDDRELHGARRRAKETDDFFRYNDFSHTHAYTRTLVGALNQALVGDEVRLLGAGLARHGCVCESERVLPQENRPSKRSGLGGDSPLVPQYTA